MKAFGLVLILLGSFSVPELSGLLAVLCGVCVVAADYLYG